MPPMEIERKFTVKALPENLDSYPFHLIEQAYLNTDPVLRIRRQDDEYYLTYKGKGLMAREEYNLPLNQSSYEHLLPKADGICISKKRYLIPWDPYTIELDVFEKSLAPLIIAEVELSAHFEVNLVYCFEKNGVLENIDDENSVIAKITPETYIQLKEKNIVNDGMIPKIDNAFAAIEKGVKSVFILKETFLKKLINENNRTSGTEITQ